ncbi:MAG: hypothetical protein K5773_05400 [Pseudobutyrivibrio sp.]|nr:hypothetical protein [Pseudobutyrivibrio sp.]
MRRPDLFSRLYLYLKRNGLAVTLKRINSAIKKRLVIGLGLNKREYFRDDTIHLAFYPSGGLGDYIISRAVLEEIILLGNFDITIFCNREDYGRAVFNDIATDIRPWLEYYSSYYKYDVALLVEHFIHVDAIKEVKVNRLSPNLFKKLKFIKDNWRELYVDISEQCWRERIQFERCRVLGLDRWTELRMGKAFDINEKKVTIPIDFSAECIWQKDFKEKKYITINYDADAMIKGMQQLKLWTKNGYEKLICMVHEQYPKLEVVQLGSEKAQKINGVDKYLLGTDLEYVKHVVKNSVCHIDCEGGLVHLATQLGTKCIVLFGPTPVHMYGYEENINIVSSICNNCMGCHAMWFYKCYRGSDEAICMKEISAEIVFESLKKVID